MTRTGYLPRKLLFALVTLGIVITFNFVLFRVLPGDPVKMLFRNPRLTQEAQERIRVQFGLDKPMFLHTEALLNGDLGAAFDSQFTAYLRNLAQGNLGVSFANRQDVGELLRERVWRTVLLVFSGELLAIFLGMAVGLLAAWKRGTRIDAAALILGLLAWALPTFILGIILLLLARSVLPAGGMVTPGYAKPGTLAYWLDVAKHLILPATTLAIVN